MSEHLKAVIQDLINGRNESAEVIFNKYVTSKTQNLAGLTEADSEKFVVAKVHCEYDDDGDTKTGTFTLYAPVKDDKAEAVTGGMLAADWMDEYEDLMHHIAQNVWGSSAMISVNEINDDDIKTSDKKPDGRDVFRAPKGI